MQEFMHEVVPCLFSRIYGCYALFNLAHLWNLVLPVWGSFQLLLCRK